MCDVKFTETGASAKEKNITNKTSKKLCKYCLKEEYH